MANLTVAIDDEVLARARRRASSQGRSVNALVREYLEAFADPEATRSRAAQLLALAQGSRAGSGHGGRQWTRDELHDR